MLIRNETKKDIKSINDVTIAAFKDHPTSFITEHFIINALRKNNVLTISLVAVIDNQIVGHIAFSPVNFSDGTRDWYGLGPISVLPEHQRKGIGKKLISKGLSRLKNINAKGCILVGDPDYYERFGFRSSTELTYEDVPKENLLLLAFKKEKPKGIVIFHESFLATDDC